MNILAKIVAFLLVVVAFVAAAVGFSALLALPVMWLWNRVATDVLAVPQVTFLQAWGLSLLAGLLFGKRS